MEGLSVRNQLRISSSSGEYKVDFSNDFPVELKIILGKPSAVLIDSNVFELYKEILDPAIQSVPHIVIDAKEENKTLDTVQKIVEYFAGQGIKRSHTLVAIGGGIIQDLCCFTASTIFRGMKWVFFPTTLLAQCDSCIGSKSSINVGSYKNQVGTFYPPEQVVIDTGFLKTLKKDELLSGLGEAIKVHYLDVDKRFNVILDIYSKSLCDFAILEEVIYSSLLIKKDVIEIDEFDRDYRNIMNYGHTFGHALETVTRYQVPHGMAVSFGIGIANYLSWKIGFLSPQVREEMEKLVIKNTAEVSISLDTLDSFWSALSRDKKNVDGDMVAILTKGFGQMFRHKMTLNKEIKEIITDYFIERGFYQPALPTSDPSPVSKSAKISVPIAVTSRSFSKNPVLRRELEEKFSDIVFYDEGESLKDEALIEYLRGKKGAIIALEKMSREVLQRLPELKVIAKYGVGLNNLDLEAMKEFGVELGWTSGVNRQSVAELTICYMLGASREVFSAIGNIHRGKWIVEGGDQLAGKTIGIIGCGNAGRQVIELLKPFTCKILGDDILDMRGYFRLNKTESASKERIYKEADIITLHIPYSPEVHHLIGTEEFALMNQKTILINTSRGGIVDESALYNALKGKKIRAAALDVFEEEPFANQKLLDLPSFYPTSHIGGSAKEAILNMGRAAISNLILHCSEF